MIKEATLNDIKTISVFVKNIYDEFLSCYHTSEGNESFYKFIESDEILTRMNTAESNIFYKTNDGCNIIGVIEIRYDSHIALLYVDKNYHKQGIAKELFQFVKNRNNIKKYTVNSSLYAIEIYKKMGFICQNENIQENQGIKYLPMIYIENITNLH